MTRKTLRHNLLIALLACGCSAAELAIVATQSGVGQPVELLIQFTPDSSPLIGLQFDVGFNPDLVKLSATPGQAVIDAHKNLASASVAPGKTRFVIAGLNRESITKGAVVRLTVTVLDVNRAGAKSLVLSNAAGTDLDARSVEIEVRNGGHHPTRSPSP